MLEAMPEEVSPTTPDSIFRLCASLAATLPFDPHSGLGGKLLYAGAIGGQSRGLLYAANIAGAASLAASGNSTALREAMRDGVIDFLVTSLEEALRILKNEIRKRQTVSVGVAEEPRTLADQILERGVLPDLLPPAAWSETEIGMDPAQTARLLTLGSIQVIRPEVAMERDETGASFVTWTVGGGYSRWLPRLDACAQSVIPADDSLRLRWLRLAPRYLGRLAQREHGVFLTLEEKASFKTAVARLLEQQKSQGDEELTATIAG